MAATMTPSLASTHIIVRRPAVHRSPSSTWAWAPIAALVMLGALALAMLPALAVVPSPYDAPTPLSAPAPRTVADALPVQLVEAVADPTPRAGPHPGR
jgi:hypothetical protein